MAFHEISAALSSWSYRRSLRAASRRRSHDRPNPLAIARILAAKYPAQPIMSYIPALSWSGSLRLAALTGETAMARESRARTCRRSSSGQTPAIAEPYRLTSLAGAPRICRRRGAGRTTPRAGALAQKAAQFILPQAPDEVVRFATGWTDDMFMASSVLSRVDNGAHGGGRRGSC